MPGWHAATEEFEGLTQLGILQEQHPDRARLFLQWQGIDWPMLVDAYNLLDVNVVPITLLIDENGIIRKRVSPRADARKAVAAFLAEPAAEPQQASSATPFRPRTIAQLEAAASDDARAQFELGVAYRMRYDDGGDAEDFARATAAWERSVALDPNQYIWRRRIQQYGPRLAKPYPFYDWVDEARATIRERGETPVELRIEPAGAELALPAKRFDAATPEGAPDPDGKVHRDAGALVTLRATAVPATIKAGETTRLHLELRPKPDADAHWNNEAGGTVVWVEPQAQVAFETHRLERPNPPEPTSDEPRRIELELKLKDNAAGKLFVRGYVLYYVCKGREGACLYRRQDWRLPLTVASMEK